MQLRRWARERVTEVDLGGSLQLDRYSGVTTHGHAMTPRQSWGNLPGVYPGVRQNTHEWY